MRKLEKKATMSLIEKLVVISITLMICIGFYIQNQQIKHHHPITVVK